MTEMDLNSLELLSLQLVQVAPEDQVFQELRLVHQVQLVPSHQENPGEKKNKQQEFTFVKWSKLMYKK